MGLVGDLVGALIGADASSSAAWQQSDAAKYAADLQAQASQNTLDFAKQIWNQQQANQQPFLNAGQGAVTYLSQLMGVPAYQSPTAGGPQPIPTMTAGGQVSSTNDPRTTYNPAGAIVPVTGPDGRVIYQPSGFNAVAPTGTGQRGTFNEFVPSSFGNLPVGIRGAPAPPPTAGQATAQTQGGYPLVGQNLLSPWTTQFVAPTDVTMQNDPGYQFRLQQGLQAIQRSAAAKGGLLSGGTVKALDQYSQGLASQEYENVYNRALQQYQQAYNIFNQNAANTYNRLAGLSGTGQVAAQQLGSQGSNIANQVGNNLLGTAQIQGQLAQDAAAARASGYYNSANAWLNALSQGNNQANSLIGMLNSGAFAG